MLTTRPRKVSTFGLTRVRASQRTMASSKTPQARPKALVQVRGPVLGPVLLVAAGLELILVPSCCVRQSRPLARCRFVVNCAQAQDLHFTFPVGCDYDGCLAHFLVEQRT